MAARGEGIKGHFIMKTKKIPQQRLPDSASEALRALYKVCVEYGIWLHDADVSFHDDLTHGFTVTVTEPDSEHPSMQVSHSEDFRLSGHPDRAEWE